jgi:hypothetical protein
VSSLSPCPRLPKRNRGRSQSKPPDGQRPAERSPRCPSSTTSLVPRMKKT